MIQEHRITVSAEQAPETIPARICLNCGGKVEGHASRPWKIYCSDKCQSTAAYNRSHPVIIREIKVCLHPACGKPLAHWNRSGLCTQHYKEHHSRRRVRKWKWGVCKKPGCGLRVKLDNQLGGYCKQHRYLPKFGFGVCKKPGCGRGIRCDNRVGGGYCKQHRYLAKLFRWGVCEKPGCRCRVRSKNQTLCNRHRKRAEIKAKLADYDRIKATALPADWSRKPEDWVFIGLILLQRDYMTNEELAVCLDASGGPKCQYSQDGSWDIITRPGPAANHITKIRKWVGRPGKTPTIHR